MNLGNSVEVIDIHGKTHIVYLYNIFYIEIKNRDERKYFLSNESQKEICIEEKKRIPNNSMIVKKLGGEYFSQIHQSHIIPNNRVIGHDAKWKYITLKSTCTSNTKGSHELFKTKELPIGAAYIDNAKDIFRKDSVRTVLRKKTERGELPDYIYVFVDSIIYIESNNKEYKRTIYLSSPINAYNNKNSYIIEEYSNSSLQSYIERFSNIFPIFFRVHKKIVINYRCVVARDKHWKHLVLKVFDNDLKNWTEVKIKIGITYLSNIKEIFKDFKIVS